MKPVELFATCWVVTRGGKVHGPIEWSTGSLFIGDDKGELMWHHNGRYFYAHDHDKEDPADVVAVYPCLRILSELNPEL